MLKAAMKFVLGCLLVITATETLLAGGTSTGVPEVDPGMMGIAIGVLTGGYLIISSRRRRK